MALLPASQTLLTVDSTKAVPVSVPQGATVTVRNDGNTVYFKSTPDVTSGSSDGSLATGTAVAFTQTKYFITAQAAPTQLIITNADTVTNPVAGKPYNVHTWPNVAATSGTDTACTNGTAYVGSVYVPAPCVVTGVQYVVGSVGGTTKVVASIHDINGRVVANSATAGATVGTAAQIQQVALTATAALQSGFYFVGVTFDGTTAKFRSVPAYCQSGVIGNGVTQTFGTVADFTAPTTFTADKVPVASLY